MAPALTVGAQAKTLGPAARSKGFVQNTLPPPQRDVTDDLSDKGRHDVVIVVHLDLDGVASVSGRALYRRIGIGGVGPAPYADVDVCRGAGETGGGAPGHIDDAPYAVVSVFVAIGAAGDRVTCPRARRMLNRDPGLEQSREIDYAEHEREEHHGDQGKLHQRLSLIRFDGNGCGAERFSSRLSSFQTLTFPLSDGSPCHLINLNPISRAMLLKMPGNSDAEVASK